MADLKVNERHYPGPPMERAVVVECRGLDYQQRWIREEGDRIMAICIKACRKALREAGYSVEKPRKPRDDA